MRAPLRAPPPPPEKTAKKSEGLNWQERASERAPNRSRMIRFLKQSCCLPLLTSGRSGQHRPLQPHRHGLPERGEKTLRQALQSAALGHIPLRQWAPAPAGGKGSTEGSKGRTACGMASCKPSVCSDVRRLVHQIKRLRLARKKKRGKNKARSRTVHHNTA